MLIFFSAQEKKWKIKKTIFFSLLFSISVGLLFYKFIGDKYFIPIFFSLSAGSCVFGYFLRPIGKFFVKGMEVSHKTADGSDEEGDRDYRW
ncbi:MAG: hypothetical protein AB1333_00775 [Patescibacteria group bacterium]